MTLSLLPLLTGMGIGAALGAIYFGLLWRAVRSLRKDRGGVALFLGLGLARIVLLIGALAVALRLGLPVEGIAAAVVGFIMVRLLSIRVLGPPPEGHAPWK